MENNTNMEFREWLHAEMVAREIGPSDLARLSKVPQPTIFRILSGETKDPRTGTVNRLERAIGSRAPPLDDADTGHLKVVAEFAATYRSVNVRGQEFLRRSIEAARAAYLAGKQRPSLTLVTDKEDESETKA